MRHPLIATAMVAIWLAAGCDKPAEAPPKAAETKTDKASKEAKAEAATPPPAVPAQKPAAKAATKPPEVKPRPKATKKKPASKLVAWDSPLEWHDWDAGLAKAKADNKPIMLLVYADW